jgi:hypothetical protein
MFFLRRMCIPNTNESALIYMVLPAWLVIHRRFCIFLFSFFNKKTHLILQEITIHLFFFKKNKIKLTSILIPKRIIICISNLGRVNNTCVRFAGGIKN